ncbi:MAG: hypothetical protein EBS19_02600 [Spirochaetia bacterium]|nr:hypothetical protein [Spirochaetia bacterium]
MDFLLLLYASFLGVILISPFLYFSLNKNELDINYTDNKLKIERKMLLENLRDLKTDFETKKFSESDFNTLSSDIVKKLEELDKKIKLSGNEGNYCVCGKIDHNPVAIYCYQCGNKLKS